MKTRISLYFLSALMLISIVSCTGWKTGKLTVEVVPLLGETVDVSGMKLELHTNAAYNYPVMTTDLSGSALLSTAQFVEIEPNTYYCRAFKDMNANSIIDAGDVYAFYPDKIEVLKKDKLVITMEAYIIK